MEPKWFARLRNKRPSDSGVCEINARSQTQTQNVHRRPAPKINVDAKDVHGTMRETGVYFAAVKPSCEHNNIELRGWGLQ